ncbi:hypothetical protein LMG28688_06092 [Paraburkholderia caffeinitolerans]|uniref:DUF1173 domain-containing protein n=1 Tax=Paraburkholderia caffeinitolerans TaxID=1723730 RepID=A0A6J5GTP2_9BURK|nr:DUF1173 family protein [Paraburkholderia caffeinitolerans]CAB3805034.1 hypothetical protein LMG28688_06092 [Paraburkholderia caffeinitolerans]
MFDVSFSGKRVSLAEVQEHPARFASRLERAKVTPGFALCHCRTDTPRKLVIRRYGSLFHLAGWPDDGVHHAERCDFHKKGVSGAGPNPDSRDAIIAGPNGMNVRLDVSLVHQETASGRNRTTGVSTGASRRAAPLLAFLQTLWTSAGLTFWFGTSKPQGWGSVNAELFAGLGDAATVNGSPAQDVLHVMRRFEQHDRDAINAEFDAFRTRIVNDEKVSRRGLVLGELAEFADTEFGKAITLRQHPQRYHVSTALADHAEKKYRRAFRAIGKPNARVIALLLVERLTHRHLRIVDLAAMLCSLVFLPCDSMYEVAMANRLVAERRRFEKPIRMAEGDEMLPDFVLLDTHPATHVEVYGMNGVASYERRKAEKQGQRLSRGIPAVEWNVDREELKQVLLPSPVTRT